MIDGLLATENEVVIVLKLRRNGGDSRDPMTHKGERETKETTLCRRLYRMLVKHHYHNQGQTQWEE